ncbi:trk system potassium uptake protein TrkA [Lachnotalea glycerini]|uniref:Trk system potassium uptake protein TrkA n=1 Tax=Lachnotalea glycerini TaxID=1763509 RepID=A0A255I996_9FIRM|nr:TrkA family potassium uptake protein [Lachnotalea glycerini]PXV91725.1 trk system potassium uptake protein TrkA [Lachnotalea glycerini]RDY30772.1 TrkA family potassium uptake protein [Lachnotalea glycerini]
MLMKEFAVFGLGEFGKSVALTLAKNGCEVLVVDNDSEKIKEIADSVTYAVTADVTDYNVLKSLGIRNLDGVIVAIAESLESSVMATIFAKELGVPYVLAKAYTEVHATVLKKVGADAIAFPEKEMGTRIAKNLVSGNFADFIELSSKFSMVEMKVPESWEGKTLREINPRDKLGVNVIAVKLDEDVNVNPNPDSPFMTNQTLIIVGDNTMLERLCKK